MKIAILHEMLIKLWGAEKVVECLMETFPEADLYTLIYDEKKVGKVFPKMKIKKVPKVTQNIYALLKNQRFCLPLMPKAVESLDLSDYDVVIVSSSWFAHGLKTPESTKVITYYHSPARYMWDWTNEYKKDIKWQSWIKGLVINRLFLKLRQWDFLASKRTDTYLSNSKNTAGRIQKYYRTDSEILYPPVETKRFAKDIPISENSEKYYIIISALTEFKKINIAISAFNKISDVKLKIIGWGGYRETLEKMVDGKNIEFLGAQYGDDLVALVQNSKGLIFPWEEDFWIVPIEVMAAGKPVFAYRWGWLLETVIESKTWAFFDHEDGKDFVEKFRGFHAANNAWKYSVNTCKEQAEKFSKEAFQKRIKLLVMKK